VIFILDSTSTFERGESRILGR